MRIPIKNSFSNQNLTSKFRIIYTLIIILCVLCNTFIVKFFYRYDTVKTISGLNAQTLDSICQNVDASLFNASKVSTYVLSSESVQAYLYDRMQGSENALNRRNLRNTLYLSLDIIPMSTSIFVMDLEGQYEGAGSHAMPRIKFNHPSEASWFEQIHALKGTPVYLLNGGGCFSTPQGEDILSIIRLVNSTIDAKPLGYMFINIPLSSLLSFDHNVQAQGYSDICVYTGKNTVLPFNSQPLNDYFANNNFLMTSDEHNITAGGKRYLLHSKKDSYLDWQYISAAEYTSYSTDFMPFLWIFLFSIAISFGLFLLIAFCTRRFVTSPLNKLTQAMQKNSDGKFSKAYVTDGNDEIGFLQNAYNEMVDKIQALLEAKISEQKQLRKSELKVLQEQIKPHFLYNSLSGIAYLIQSKQNDSAENLILSLSEYYRESLSKGNEVISLATEINILKNYLKLQKMRYQGTFEDNYDIDEETLAVQIPRLTLQPLVENALYHGILPTGEGGTILISSQLDGTNLVLKIKDDGVGISSQLLQDILTDGLEKSRQGFGLRRTIERLQIFYEKKDIFTIVSAPDQGTEITFTLPYINQEKTDDIR